MNTAFSDNGQWKKSYIRFSGWLDAFSSQSWRVSSSIRNCWVNINPPLQSEDKNTSRNSGFLQANRPRRWWNRLRRLWRQMLEMHAALLTSTIIAKQTTEELDHLSPGIKRNFTFSKEKSDILSKLMDTCIVSMIIIDELWF